MELISLGGWVMFYINNDLYRQTYNWASPNLPCHFKNKQVQESYLSILQPHHGEQIQLKQAKKGLFCRWPALLFGPQFIVRMVFDSDGGRWEGVGVPTLQVKKKDTKWRKWSERPARVTKLFTPRDKFPCLSVSVVSLSLFPSPSVRQEVAFEASFHSVVQDGPELPM